MLFENIQFNFAEVLSILGLAQAIYILVYMMLRVKSYRYALIPLCYFLFMGAAFFLDFGERFISDYTVYYDSLKWALWFSIFPLGALLMLQLAYMSKLPSLKDFAVMLIIPIAYVSSFYIAHFDAACVDVLSCSLFDDALIISGIIGGSVSMLFLWLQRKFRKSLHKEKITSDRYWLVIALMIVNMGFIAAALVYVSALISFEEFSMVRTILGVGLAYVAGTSLFRIYPQSIKMLRSTDEGQLTAEEEAVAVKIIELLELQKVYHEQNYGRTELAQELGVAETLISKVINLHFKKSLPQLLNEYRVEDAKRMLRETDASVQIVAEDVGFNSSSSFNRVFRDISGISPTEYRKRTG